MRPLAFSLIKQCIAIWKQVPAVCAAYYARACSGTLKADDAAEIPCVASGMRNARYLRLAGLRGRERTMKVSRGKWRARLWTCKRKGMWKAAARWKGATP